MKRKKKVDWIRNDKRNTHTSLKSTEKREDRCFSDAREKRRKRKRRRRRRLRRRRM